MACGPRKQQQVSYCPWYTSTADHCRSCHLMTGIRLTAANAGLERSTSCNAELTAGSGEAHDPEHQEVP
eukprot:8016792-Prorocentrum_lima.AAC.1